MPPTLPEGITRDRKPSGLPEGITRDNKPVSIYPSAEEMFSTTNEILTRLPALDKENRALFETGRKKLDASIYLSEKSGRPVDEIVNNYEMMSVAHKYSGNHEADWEKMLGQIQHKNQIKEQQLEALKEATGLDKAKNAMGAFVGGMTSVPAATVDWVAISAYQLQQNFPDFFERANNFLGKENTSSPDDLATAQFAKWMVNKAEEIAPTNPALKGQFWSDTVPNAAGSMTTFLIGGGLGKKILKSTVTPVLAMGMTGQGSSGYRDAIANGATERQALYSFLLNTGAGASEVLPISMILNRIGAPSKKKAITYLRNAGIEGLGEFIQESIVSGTSNVIAQQIYDADRKFWDGVLESGAAGGVTGVLASFLVSALPGKQNISMKNTGAGKVNESIPNEEGWALAREHMSDAQLEDKFGPNGVFAANGDKEAQKAFEESLIPDVEAMNAKAEEEALSQPPEAVLIEEAKKYKTADEFVDAYWNTDATKYLTDTNDGNSDDSVSSRGSTKSKAEIEHEFRNDLKTNDQLSDFEKSIRTEFGQFIRFSNSDGRALGGRLFGLMAKSSGYDQGIPTLRTEIIVGNGLSEAMTLRVIGHEMIHRKLAHLDEKTANKVLSAVKELVNDKKLIASVRANWKINGKNTNFGPVMEEILAEHGSRIFGSKFNKAATLGKVSITDTAMSIFKDLLRLIQFSLNGKNKKGIDAIAKDLFELSNKAIAGKYKDQKISIFLSNQNIKANESKLLEINEQSNPENNNKRFLTKAQLIDIWNKAHNQTEAIAEENVEKAPPVKVEELKQPLLNEDQLAQVEELILELETVAVEKDVQARVDDKPMTSAESQLLELEIQEEIDGLGRKEKADATKLARITKLEDRLYAIKKGSALDKKQALMDLRAEKNQQLKTQREKAGVKFANEVNKRLTLVKRHFKQKKDLRESMGLLIDIVKLMPRPIRGDLLGQIRSLSTKVSPESQIRVLDTAVEMASAKVDRFLAIESRNNLRKITKPLIKEIKAARAGQKKPNKELQLLYDYLSERGLIKNDTRDIIQIKNKELQARIEDAENKGNEYSLSEEEQLLMIQALSPDLNRNDLTYNEYKAAIADIETLKKEGLTVRQKKLHEEKIKVNAKIALIASEIDQRLDIKGKKELSPSEVKEFQGKMALLSAGKFALIDYRSVSKLLTGLKNGGKIKKFIFDEISKGMSESIVSHEQYIQFINRLENQYSIDVKNLSSTDLIRIGNRSMSVHEAMFVYGHSQNRHGQRHLANTEFGGIRLKERVVDDIVSSLSSNHKQFVDELISYNDAVMYPKLNKMFQRLYGLDMPKVLRYLPLSNLNHGNAFDSILGEAFTIATTADSFLKERTASKASFTSLDLIGTLYRHNQAAEHTLAMKEIIQTTQSILRNKPLQNKINSIDKKANAWIKDYLQDVARGQMSPPNSEAIAILRLLRNNVRTFFIALNPGSWLKTQTPIISAMQDIDKGAMLSTLMRPWNGYSNWETAKTKSKFMASRKNTARIEILEIAQLKDHYSRSTSEGIKKLGAKAALFNTRMQESAYWIYSPLDLASTSAVWVSKYRSELSKDGNEDRAIQAADEVVKVHFPSGRVEELAALFRSGGLEKELTVFTSDMNRMFNLGYSKSQLNERKIQEAIAYAVYSLLLSSIFLAATDFAWDRLREAFGIKKPEDNKKERVLQDAARYLASQSLGGIPLVGTGAEGAMAKLTGDAMMSEMIMRQTPIYAYPLVQIGRGNYVSAASSAVGIPGANLLSPMIDDYLKDEDYYELERPQDND